jgi:hypothetical protein
VILERENLVADFGITFVHEHLAFEKELLVTEEGTVDRLWSVVLETSLCLIINHAEHIVSVLIVPLARDQKTSSESSGGCFSDCDL